MRFAQLNVIHRLPMRKCIEFHIELAEESAKSGYSGRKRYRIPFPNVALRGRVSTLCMGYVRRNIQYSNSNSNPTEPHPE